MTVDEFRRQISLQSDAALVDLCLYDDSTPFIFERRTQRWDDFRAEFATLGAAPADIRIVGSGRFGFSTRPGARLRPYTDRSDIDVLIVNPALFDRLWLALLTAAYPRGQVTERLGGWLRTRQKELYTGWLSPLEVKLDRRVLGSKVDAVLEFNYRWFTTFQEASRHPVRRHEHVNGRLYRTWEHATLYHLHSISELRLSLAD